MRQTSDLGSALDTRLRIRLLRQEDIAERVAIYSDPRVRSNLAHVGALMPPDEMTAAHQEWLAGSGEERLMYRLSSPAGELVGFTWLTELDWVNQTCELSIAILPEYRSRMGLLALLAMYDFLYNTMNMQIIVNQVLSVNEMLLRSEVRADRAQVVSEDDCFTSGALRTNYRWTQDRAEHESFTRMAIERRDRIRSRLAERLPEPEAGEPR